MVHYKVWNNKVREVVTRMAVVHGMKKRAISRDNKLKKKTKWCKKIFLELNPTMTAADWDEFLELACENLPKRW